MSYLLISLVSSVTVLGVLAVITRFRRVPALTEGGGRSGAPSRTGGLAMALGLGVAGLLAASNPVGTGNIPATGIMPALIGALLVFFIGWIDDIRPLEPGWKLLGQIAAASLSYSLGLRAGFLPDGLFNHAFTVFCLVGGANALNLIDGMDGLAATIAAVSATFFFFIARDLGQVNAAALAAGVAGVSLAFLWLNLPPARVYMGDSGSNLLGFALVSVTLLLSSGTEGFGNFSTSLVLLTVPIADTATTILRRVMIRRSPFQADLDHVHHRLLRQGLSQGAVLLLLGGVTLTIGLCVRYGGDLLSMATEHRTIAAWLGMGSLVALSSIYMLSGRPGQGRPRIEDKPDL